VGALSVRPVWGVDGAPGSSADLLRQLDDDPLRDSDVAKPVAVLVALQLADEFSAAGSQAGDDGVDVLDRECVVAIPGVLAGACRLPPSCDGV